MDAAGATATQQHLGLAFKHVPPFPSLVIVPPDYSGRGGNMIGRGGAFVLGVHRAIVFKFPPTYHFFSGFDDIMGKHRIWISDANGEPVSAKYGPVASPQEMASRHRKFKLDHQESITIAVTHEGEMLHEIAKKLRVQGCVHIIQPHLSVREGLFLPRLQCSLQDRIDAETCAPVLFEAQWRLRKVATPLRLKIRWAKQLASALAWMERAGLHHGDLRPANVLLDDFENVVLADFGSCEYTDFPLRTGANVFCPGEFVVGNARSEQYAFGWCLYNLCHGSIPSTFDISDPSKVIFPSVDDVPLAKVIDKCWYLEFQSLADLEKMMLEEYSVVQPWYYRVLDFGSECLASLVLACSRAYTQRKMRLVCEKLRSGPAAALDKEAEQENAKAVQRIYS